MTLLSQDETRALARRVGFRRRESKIAAAIAMCEALDFNSGKVNFSAVGDQELANSTWGYSYGGWQIRSLRAEKGTGGTRDEDRLLDPWFNAKSALSIRRGPLGWGAWSTFKDGKYKAYLQDMFPPDPGTYIVVGGDTLSSIAAKLPGSWEWQDLARENGIHAPYSLRIGDVLRLP